KHPFDGAQSDGPPYHPSLLRFGTWAGRLLAALCHDEQRILHGRPGDDGVDRGAELHLGESWLARDDGLRRRHVSVWNPGLPCLLVRRNPRDSVPGACDAAVLLHLQNAFRSGLSATALRRGRPLAFGYFVRSDDDSDERHQYVFHGRDHESHSWMEYSLQHLGLFTHGGDLCDGGRIALRHLQRSFAVHADLAGLPGHSHRWIGGDRWLDGPGAPHRRKISRTGFHPHVEHDRVVHRQSHGNTLDWHRVRLGPGDFVRLLDDGFPCGAARDGGQGPAFGTDRHDHRRVL